MSAADVLVVATALRAVLFGFEFVSSDLKFERWHQSIIPRCLITFTTPSTKSATASSCICPTPPASARIAGIPLSAAAA